MICCGHPYYDALNRPVSKQGFDEAVERLCRLFYAERRGQPSLPPAISFRLLLVGGGIDSEQGIAWRVADSLTLRDLLGYELSEQPPNHSTISRNRRLSTVEVHEEIRA